MALAPNASEKRLTKQQAKQEMEALLASPSAKRLIRSLVAALFSDRPDRNSTVKRLYLVSEQAPERLSPYCDELIGILTEAAPEDWRTRCYLGLVVARAAESRAQRLRLAPIFSLMAEDERNAVRCTALEGMVRIAAAEEIYREEATRLLEEARRTGTPAMKARARHMALLLRRHTI